MGHFNTLQISETPLKPEEHIHHIVEDELFNTRSDWGGEPAEDECLQLEQLKNELKPLGELDIDQRTIALRPKEELLRDYRTFIEKEYNLHIEELKNGHLSWWGFHRAIEDFMGIDTLFYHGYCMTSSYLIQEYVNGYLPQTLYIGTVIDAHC